MKWAKAAWTDNKTFLEVRIRNPDLISSFLLLLIVALCLRICPVINPNLIYVTAQTINKPSLVSSKDIYICGYQGSFYTRWLREAAKKVPKLVVRTLRPLPPRPPPLELSSHRNLFI